MALLISKTTFLEFLACPKNIWLKLHRPELAKEFALSSFELQLAEQGNEVELYARKLYPTAVLVTKTGDDAVRATEQFMTALSPAIFQATFVVDGFIAKNDVLAYNAETKVWDLYEIKGTNSLHEDGGDRDHIDDIAFQASVLRRAKVPTGKYYILHLNKEYVRMGDLDIKQLFIVDDVTEKVDDRLPQVEEQMASALHHLTSDTEPIQGCDCIYEGRSAQCSTFRYSNPHVPKYSIHDLARIGSSKKKLQTLVERELFGFDELPDDVALSDIQNNQVQVHLSQKPIIDQRAIASELEGLTFPLYFLDYETFAPAIPMFSGFSPYKRIPFQFSLHILREPDGELEHIEYLHEEQSDPSEIVAKMLSEHIHGTGMVISWNKSFEQGVNKELAKRQPDYLPALEWINAHMYDLRDIFQKQYYVHPEFKGKTSIKKVLPALIQGLKHADLDIAEGGAASDAWAQLISPARSTAEKAKIASDLRTYCKLDTHAMYQIWHHLHELVKV
jgi:hypothetical protein